MRPLDPAVVRHLRPARLALGGMVVAGTLAGLLVVAQAFALAGLLTAAVTGHSFRDWAVALAAVVAGRAAFGWLADVCAARAATTVGTTLRSRLLATSLRRGPSWLARRRDGELALLTTRGVAAVEPYLTRYLPALVLAAVLPVATVVAIASQDLVSAGIVLLTLPLLPVFAALVGMATRDRAERQWQLLGTLSGHFLDVVRGLPTLVVHRRAEAQVGRIRTITQRYRRATADTLRLAFASSAVLELVATLSVALVAVVVGLRLAGGSLDLRTALVVLLLAPEAYWPVRKVGAEFHAAAEGTATLAAADAILDEPGATPRPARGPRPPGSGDLVLDGLSIRYDGRETDALAPVCATIPAVGLTAVVGPSGAGKSTLLAVLLGQLPRSGGRMTVDGTEVDPEDERWRARVAWVPQRPWLAAGTVRDNVRMGRPAASDAEIWRALEQVDLAEHVATLPEGLDAEVGEDGLGLSAGERARLVLARAVVSNRRWVLLDEPTAHLDPATETVVARTLARLAETRAVVVVAHRDALVTLADQVVRIEPSRPATDDPARPRPAGPSPASRDSRSVEDAVSGRRRWWRGEAAGVALGSLATAAGVALTATAGWLIVRASEQPPVLVLMVAIVGVRAFGLARPALRYVERLVSHDAALDALAERRAEVYATLVPLVPGRLGRPGHRRGEVLAGIVDDVDALVDRRLRVAAPLWTAALVVPTATLVASLALPTAGLAVAACAGAGGLAAYLLARLGARRAEPAFVAARAELADRVTATLEGAADLVAWQATERAAHEVAQAGSRMARTAERSARAVGAGRAVALLGAGLGVVAVAQAGTGRIAGPVLALVALLPLALLDAVSPLADAGALSVRTDAAEQRLEVLRSTPPAVRRPLAPAPLAPGTDVEVDAVAAGWDDRPVLRDLDLSLPPGTRLGVVGPSGCGKSTLAALLVRFLDPTEGTVRLEGTDLRELDPDAVRRVVGLLDEPHVFSSSLVENVRLARPDAADAEVEAVLRAARLGDWLDALPLGLDTPLGDGRADLSGGERTRLGMARALLADWPVLVLDEPTAHLDTATAEALAADLLAPGPRTLVWVTHGLVGLDRMDAVLDLGSPMPLVVGGRLERWSGAVA